MRQEQRTHVHVATVANSLSRTPSPIPYRCTQNRDKTLSAPVHPDVIDPNSDTIVWQYGHTGKPGSKPGYLHTPDSVDLFP